MRKTSRPASSKSAAAAPHADCVATVVQRKYLADLRPAVAGEFSARIEHEQRYAFFPLGTSQRDRAVTRAATIRRTVAQWGWSQADARFIREFTLAIFWLPNPLTCTYATLFTARTQPARVRKPGECSARLIFYEPEAAVRWGMLEWLNLLADFECTGAHGSTTDFLKDVKRHRPDLVLYHDPPCASDSAALKTRLTKECPDQAAFPFGVYRDSEHAWYSVTGVDGGYYYRRRPPTQLFEPVSGLWPDGKPDRNLVESRIRHHMRTLFGLRTAPEQNFPGLTKRECDVLMGLRQGHTDKSLAARLGISSWTVHTHMKSLFDKLGVHTRAEAVAKFFQK